MGEEKEEMSRSYVIIRHQFFSVVYLLFEASAFGF